MPLNLFLPCLFIFCSFCSLNSYAQKSTAIGINFTFESTYGPLRPGIGATAERQLTRHSGIESGIYYRNHVYNQYLTFEGPPGSPAWPFTNATLTISERLLSIPVLYKYYSRIVNASIGPTFDFYIGWRQKNSTPLLTVNEYNVDPNFSLGAMIKISKNIPVASRISIEPELRYNVIFEFEREHVGFGVAAKYKLK